MSNTTIKTPDFIAYKVQEGGDNKNHWNRIGAAWKHADEEGLNIVLHAVPLSGKITLRTPKDKTPE